MLGDQPPFSDTLKFDKPYWLGIKVGNDAELSPRIALTSAGYSFSSIRSDTAKNVINGKVVKSLNGLKDNIKIMGSGGTSINTNGDTITISSSSGSAGGIQEIKSANSTMDINNPAGPTTTLDVNISKVIKDNAVRSLNGMKNDLFLKGDGGTTVDTQGDTITISSSTSSGSGLKGIQNTNNTLDIKDPNGPTTTLNLKLPVSSAVTSDTAKNIENGKVVQSLNGLKDDVQLEGSGGTTVNTSGNKITISSNSNGEGIQEIQNTNNTIDITNPKGSTATLNVNIPNVINGNAVKSLNGVKNDVT